MANFEPAFKATGANEGFYSNDPTDGGGETIFGIARKKNPHAGVWPIVDRLKHVAGFPGNMKNNVELIAATKQFYKAEFWDRVQGDKIINQEAASELYDSAVNMGVRAAVLLTQQALEIAQSGVMDNDTLDALNAKNNYA